LVSAGRGESLAIMFSKIFIVISVACLLFCASSRGASYHFIPSRKVLPNAVCSALYVRQQKWMVNREWIQGIAVHRVIEWPGLQRTTMLIQFQPPAMCRVANHRTRLPRATFGLFWPISVAWRESSPQFNSLQFLLAGCRKKSPGLGWCRLSCAGVRPSLQGERFGCAFPIGSILFAVTSMSSDSTKHVILLMGMQMENRNLCES